MTRTHLVAGVGVLATSLLLALWLGVPVYKRTRADAMIDELCAKDGGIKVYETVKVPANRFDRNGNAIVPNLKHKKASDEYYYTNNITWIVQGGRDPNDLVIWRDHIELYRSSDGKLLATATYYARRGGDPPSLMHPSSYRCPSDTGIEQKVFLKN